MRYLTELLATKKACIFEQLKAEEKIIPFLFVCFNRERPEYFNWHLIVNSNPSVFGQISDKLSDSYRKDMQ